MSGLIIFIICMVLAVLTFKKVSNSSRGKGKGKLRTFFTSFSLSLFVFIILMGGGGAIISSKDKGDASNKSVTNKSTNETNGKMYTCHKFDVINQTRQGTKYKSGVYSDQVITYTITEHKLINKRSSPGNEGSTDTAIFNKIADDGSRKYGNAEHNYFVYPLNDNAIKVVAVHFFAKMTITQTCSK
ncbi:hypothetical protein LVQ78_11170 [Buttiauxella sp. A2-C2_NF]|uniref:hypothetical protein n=1 Tax=Buttiauxella ferragutiae TaxID=82989 RepID=UPI001E628823|nr:hypothetical protein [Buttiauxella ferragutiae]MCE0826590.1 hypothetical protein [Buttiauxella ferragutiae]